MRRKEARKQAVRPCPHLGRCGGCLDFLADHESRCEELRSDLQERLRRVLGASCPEIGWLHPVLPGPPRHFRNRLLYPLRPDREGRLQGGLFARNSHELVPIRRCEIQHGVLTKAALSILRLLRDRGVQAYDEGSGRGFARSLEIRWMPSTGEGLIVLATLGGRWPEGPALAKDLLELPRPRGFHPVGVVRSLHDEPGNRHLGRRQVPLAGRDYLTDRVVFRDRELRFRISAGSFYQSHLRADRLLLDPVMDRIGELDGARTADVFGGVGVFGLRMAAAGAREVHLFERNRTALRDARHNAARNGFAGVFRFHGGGFGPPAVSDLPEGLDLCLCDPPRKGLGEEGIEVLRSKAPRRLVLVSCDPSSLCRDLPPLRARGYDLRALQAADLFPHSGRLELVAFLERGPR